MWWIKWDELKNTSIPFLKFLVRICPFSTRIHLWNLRQHDCVWINNIVLSRPPRTEKKWNWSRGCFSQREAAFWECEKKKKTNYYTQLVFFMSGICLLGQTNEVTQQFYVHKNLSWLSVRLHSALAYFLSLIKRCLLGQHSWQRNEYSNQAPFSLGLLGCFAFGNLWRKRWMVQIKCQRGKMPGEKTLNCHLHSRPTNKCFAQNCCRSTIKTVKTRRSWNSARPHLFLLSHGVYELHHLDEMLAAHRVINNVGRKGFVLPVSPFAQRQLPGRRSASDGVLLWDKNHIIYKII